MNKKMVNYQKGFIKQHKKQSSSHKTKFNFYPSSVFIFSSTTVCVFFLFPCQSIFKFEQEYIDWTGEL